MTIDQIVARFRSGVDEAEFHPLMREIDALSYPTLEVEPEVWDITVSPVLTYRVAKGDGAYRLIEHP